MPGPNPRDFKVKVKVKVNDSQVKSSQVEAQLKAPNEVKADFNFQGGGRNFSINRPLSSLE